MQVLIVGGTGLLGRRVAALAVEAGHKPVVTSRHPARAKAAPGGVATVQWDTRGPLPKDLAPDAIVAVGGANLFGHRWTRAYKREIVESRVDVNRRLVAWASKLAKPPRVFVTASAVGYYGAAPAGPVTESSPSGDDFLARLCVDWEAAAEGARVFDARVVAIRSGILLDPEGGALQRLGPIFRMFAGGPIGSGRQPFPWILAEDDARIVVAALDDARYDGPVNGVAPERVDNRTFSEALGKALHRPSWAPVPPFVLSAMYGDGADVLTKGQEVVPEKLTSLGFSWEAPRLAQALARLYNGR